MRARRRRRAAMRAAAICALAVGVAGPPLRRRLGLSPPVVSAIACLPPLALPLVVPRSRARDAALYALQMWAYYAHYDMPDDDPEALRRRTRVDYPIAVDRRLGCGEAPTLRLQRTLGREGRIRPHDVALSLVHWSWFVVPHGALLFVMWRRPEGFPRSATLMAACFDLGCVVYWLVPTAPPWYAAEIGRLPPVRRIMEETGKRVWKGLWKPLYHSLEGNPFAAMPSLHFGTSVMAARVLSGVGRAPGAVGWAYALSLGFGLVYLGEHYVVDLLAGFALAEGVWRLAPRAAPAARSIAERVSRLEPRAS